VDRADVDKNKLADRIRGIDPFMHSIEGIREHICGGAGEKSKRHGGNKRLR